MTNADGTHRLKINQQLSFLSFFLLQLFKSKNKTTLTELCFFLHMLRSCSSGYDVYPFAVLSRCEPRCGQCSKGAPTQQLLTGGNACKGMITIKSLMRIGSKAGIPNSSKGIFRQHGHG